MSDEAAFLAAIRAAPADDAPRLVYADWLDEHGRPEQAEAIRAEHARRAGLARWEAIRDRVDSGWLASIFTANAVVIRSYPRDQKIAVIKLIREFTGLGLADSKAFSESLPICLKGNGSSESFDRIRADFRAIGVEANREYVVPG